jgi:hypothetical protein
MNDRKLCGVWCQPELMKAVEKGYRIGKIEEVWHYPDTMEELFKDYVNTFLKIKTEASGYPPHVQTDEEKDKYIADFEEHEGIKLEKDKIMVNPGLRALAKLFLNR